MSRQLKVDKIYQGFRQGKSQKLSKTLQQPDAIQSRVINQLGNHVEQSINLGVNRLSKQTQERIRSNKQFEQISSLERAKEEEQKKFEILQVLNLLGKTEIHSNDLFKRS